MFFFKKSTRYLKSHLLFSKTLTNRITQYSIIQGRINFVDHSIKLGIINDMFMPKDGSINQSANNTKIAIIKFFILTAPSLKQDYQKILLNFICHVSEKRLACYRNAPYSLSKLHYFILNSLFKKILNP